MENSKVEIYTTKTCPDCKAAKEFLSKSFYFLYRKRYRR
ncbi:MAG: glutaredoxin family protein [Bacillota bacterium]